MRILQFGKFYYPTLGGIEQVTYEITQGLNDKNIDCDVLCSNSVSNYEESAFDNYTVYRTASYGLVKSTSITPQLIYKLWKISSAYDIIHLHHPNPIAFLALYIVRPKSKIVLHWHSDIIRQKKLLRFFLPLQNWVLNRCDKIITTSKTYAQHSPCLEKFQDKLEVIPIGISDSKIVSNLDNVKAIKETYKNKKIIFALGRLVSYKGFEYLVKSAKYLGDDLIILIGGGGEDKNFLEDLIISNNLQDRVKLLGYISEQEKYDYFEICFLFCLPSITKAEAFGVVLLEAMVFAKPIVSSKILESGISWVNEDNVSGLQVKAESSQALADSFKKLADDEELYQRLCTNSFKRYQTLFTKDKMIYDLIKLYNSIL